jgi:hypothetical protein
MGRLTALVAALGLVVAACGGGGDHSSAVASLTEVPEPEAAADSGGSGDPEAAMIALTLCLRENGVDIGDPTVDADGNVRPGEVNVAEGVDRRQVMGPALEACAEEAEAVQIGFGRGDDAEIQDTLLEFAACMRENGFDMPDPDFSGAGGSPGSGEGQSQGGGPFGDIDRDDSEFITAQSACEDILAGFGPGGGRFGGGPPGGSDDG